MTSKGQQWSNQYLSLSWVVRYNYSLWGCVFQHLMILYLVKCSHQAQGKKQQLVSIHANIKDPNQACELSMTVLITMLISTSLLCLSPTITSSAAYHVKEQSVLGTNAPFTNKV